MNATFRRLPLPAKLVLIGLVPLIFLLYLSVQINNEKKEKIDILNASLHKIETSVAITDLIFNLQQERRYSFGNIINNDWRKELVLQRPKTDAAIRKLTQSENPSLHGIRNYTFLNDLPAIRSQIDNGNLNPNDVMSYFTNTIFRLNTLNNVSAGIVTYLDPVYDDLTAQKLLSEMATFLGFLRSNIYYILYTKQNSEQAFESLKSIYSIFNSYEAELYTKASAKVISEYNGIKETTDLKPTISYLKTIFDNKNFDSTYDAEKWWEVSANAVDEISILQKATLQKAQDEIQGIHTDANNSKNSTLLFIFITIGVILFFVTYAISSITIMLTELKEAAETISKGIPGATIKIESNDVIGSLARSIERIDINNNTLATAADELGKGNFDVAIVPRSNHDQLGNAVVKMKDNLLQYNIESEEKIWIHTGNEEINNSILGEKNIAALTADVLNALASFLHCQTAFFYVNTGTSLQYCAGYAVDDAESIPKQIKFGETLIGQVAVTKEIMQLNDLPQHFTKIKSATGYSKPTSIIIIPLLLNDGVEGVIELGSISPFDSKVISFLKQSEKLIAISLHTAKSRERLQELLEETQAQSEELQAQHSELEHLNTELEEHTQRLQASEEELKVQHEELLQANAELEERSRQLEERNQIIIERNREVKRKADELEISSKYKSEFLANMSHELRTPLNSILLLSRLLSENNDKNLSKDQVEYAQVIQSSGNGLLSLIDEILDLSKIESGKMELEIAPLQLTELVADMNALFLPLAKHKGLDFSIHIEEQMPDEIHTDKMRLEQIIKNLLSNAIKFTQAGWVKLDMAPAANKNGYLAFTVKDSGIGIPAEKQQMVFEAFQQADGSTRRKFGGTGLGLSISRELAKLLGGEIHLKSEAGKGSEFTVYIPAENYKKGPETVTRPLLNEQVETPTNGFEKVEAATNSKSLLSKNIPESLPDDRMHITPDDKTILIIEDDTAFAKILLNFTHQKGYKGIVAVRGDEGIEMAQKHKPVGILLDIQLPVKDGWQVMEELKSNTQTRHIPVHIMSSHQVKKESMVKGAIDFINKPVSPEKIQDVFLKLEKVLSKKTKKVLIVEENPKHAKALAYFLETFNVASQISGSVTEGIQALQKDDVDCVILDMGIPDKTGYETLETVKKDAGLENLPVIIFTGKSLSQAEEAKIKQYADSIVVKTAHSYQRILDEVSIFLHLINDKKEKREDTGFSKMVGMNDVLEGKTILITDDDVRNIFSLARALEGHKMNVISATDGKEALKQLEQHPKTDVVLMDIMMPEMDGYEAMKEIRRNKAFKNMPIIAVTAKAMSGDREKCIQAGASDYISKPVDVDQLLSLLRVWLYDKGI